ncbi:hypothetical protein EDEG_02621 [Edhazardia aedis USNM 41457]|uniref:ABC transporter domain-containing protein n=1 Tax=Edhazardia aedis (strain USNM 41457) TaxID=1003232 RepID=J9DNK9_EDHAE|nr:hypothetical protein EDEG_02621 [Edhazardia aedis USNM 41457]|eukprot:EJW02977.1 hypothetical protein EDEG_02621 [Edhazardia aedis USNM 41457]
MEIIFNNITVKAKTKGKWITILNNISGKIPKGSMVALIGESGSGKTTLMHVLCGIVSSSSNYIVEGEITVDGKPRDPTTWFEKFGLVRQEDLFNEEETVYECISNSAKLFYERNDKKFIDAICKKYLQLLNIEEIKNSRIKVISGGQKKRLSIACVLLKEPDIVFLDEPFTGLDTNNAINLGNFLKHGSVNFGTTFLFSDHVAPLEIKLQLDCIILLFKSDMVYSGSIHELNEIYKNLGIKTAENICPVEHLSMLSDKVFEYNKLCEDSGVVLNKLIELNRQNTAKITSGKGKFIYPKRLFFFAPSFAQIWTLICRRFRLTYFKGIKRILGKFYSLLPLIIYISTKILQFGLTTGFKTLPDGKTQNQDDNEQLAYLISRQTWENEIITTSFLILSTILLGHLWEIIRGDLKITKDELILRKYNIVTYTLYVIMAASIHLSLVTAFTFFPVLFYVIAYINVIDLAVIFILKILLFAFLMSFGMAFSFATKNLFIIVKFINQIFFVAPIIEFLPEILHNDKDNAFKKYAKCFPLLIFFLTLLFHINHTFAAASADLYLEVVNKDFKNKRKNFYCGFNEWFSKF